MPRFTTPDGRTVYIPGVYSDIKVTSNLPGPLPAFQIPVIVGEADEASYPYTFNSVKQAVEDEHLSFVGVGTSSRCKEEFGADANVSIAMAWAKRHKLPWAFIVAINALTRASVVAQSGGPVTQGVIFAKKFGAVGGHIKLRVVGGTTVQITPVRRYSLLTANALTGATRLYVKDSTWLSEGDSVVVGDNNSADATYVVDSVGTALTSTGQITHYIELTTALGADITTAQYGMALVYNEDAVEAPDAFADVQEMVDWLNDESDHLGFQKDAGFTNPASLVALATATPIKEIAAWGAPTAGTSPAATTGDHQTFITNLGASDWDDFALENQVLPQAFLVLSANSTTHGDWRDWAVEKRTEGFPVSITTGCAWGDTALAAGGDTNPKVRAAALNSQDVALCAGGLDKVAAYLSLAPAVFGLRVKGGVKHNLTNDEIKHSTIEVKWDERNSGELTDLHKKGVITYRLSVAGGRIAYRVSQGLSTLQNNATSWNEVDATTPLLMQRDIADFCDRVIKEDLDATQIGGDEVTESSVSAVVVKRCQKSLLKRGYITAFSISGIELNDTGAGWDVDVALTLPVTSDYIGLRTTILIGE